MTLEDSSNNTKYILPICLASFLLPLKLAASYVVLIPMISLFFLHKQNLIDLKILLTKQIILRLLAAFLTLSILCSFFGINPTNSVIKVGRLSFFLLFIPFVFLNSNRNNQIKFLFAVIAGQTLAAIHTIYNSVYANIPNLFLGEVTESGQLALTIPVAIGLLIYSLKANSTNQPLKTAKHIKLYLILGALQFISLCLISFSNQLQINKLQFGTLIATSALMILLSLYSFSTSLKQVKCWISSSTILLSTIIGPILTAAIIINLKRGPWLGVTIAGIILLWIYARKYIIPTLLVIIFTFIALDPVRERLYDSSRDFFIAGGRNVIWQIGLELIQRFPLGIGFNNSGFLRSFSPDIPPNLTHFHSNFLNILVETGWLNLSLYLAWLCLTIKIAFLNHLSKDLKIISVSIGCALISWQVAGLVEYNFGDSEVLIIALLFMGILLKINSAASKEKK